MTWHLKHNWYRPIIILCSPHTVNAIFFHFCFSAQSISNAQIRLNVHNIARKSKTPVLIKSKEDCYIFESTDRESINSAWSVDVIRITGTRHRPAIHLRQLHMACKKYNVNNIHHAFSTMRCCYTWDLNWIQCNYFVAVRSKNNKCNVECQFTYHGVFLLLKMRLNVCQKSACL